MRIHELKISANDKKKEKKNMGIPFALVGKLEEGIATCPSPGLSSMYYVYVCTGKMMIPWNAWVWGWFVHTECDRGPLKFGTGAMLLSLWH